MEQVPHVAMYCHEEKDSHQWMHLVPSFLLPLVVRYLTDVNNQVGALPQRPLALVSSLRAFFLLFSPLDQVRKTAQAALLVLLEQELVARNDVEDQVCPLLLMLTNADAHDDFRTEAAAVSYPSDLFSLVFKWLLFLFFSSCSTLFYCVSKKTKRCVVKDMGSEMLALRYFHTSH